MFKPKLVGKEIKGIHEQTKNSIFTCDMDIRRELCGNVVLSGGTTMFEGLEKRTQKELQALIPKNVIAKVIAPAERK